MNPKEESYLTKYRALGDLKNKIIARIAELREICNSLNDWPATAEFLCNPGVNFTHSGWGDDSLKDMLALKSTLIVYHQQMNEIRREWSQMSEKEKSGFADPATLQPQKSP